MKGEEQPFICPECGSRQAGMVMKVSTIHNPNNPWSSVLSRTTCHDCKFVIPDHLAERWDDITYEEAQKEWKSVYRKSARKQKM